MNNVKKFYLAESEAKFISANFPGFNLNNKLLIEDNLFVLKLDSSEQKKIIDGLSDLFISVGLKEDCEPNEVGLQIEHLIDIFNPY